MGRERGQDTQLWTALGLCILKDSPPRSISLNSQVPDSSLLSILCSHPPHSANGGTVSTGNGTKWPAHLLTEPISSTHFKQSRSLNSDSGSHRGAMFDLSLYKWSWSDGIKLKNCNLIFAFISTPLDKGNFIFNLQDLEIHYINIECHEWKQ